MQTRINAALIKSINPRPLPFEIYDTELKGFLLRVQPSGAVSYYITYRNSERARNRVLVGKHPSATPAQARDHAKKLLASVVHGNDPAQDKRKPTGKTFDSFLNDDYGPWVKVNMKDGISTLARIESCFDKFRSMKLSDITVRQIEGWKTKRLTQGTHPVTVNRDIAALRSSFRKAVEWGILDNNPLHGIKPIKAESNKLVRFLSAIEESNLRLALNTREERIRSERERTNKWRRERDYPELPDLRGRSFADHLKPMVLVSINTGLRQGELFTLGWNDVDFSTANIRVQGSHSKSGKTRHIPLNAEASKSLANWRDQQSDTSGLVFPSVEGQPFDNVTKAWKSALTLANIKDFRWHDLRHHFASRLVMAKVDLNTVRELLGHADIQMTLRYAHLAPEHKAAAVAKLLEAPPTP